MVVLSIITDFPTQTKHTLILGDCYSEARVVMIIHYLIYMKFISSSSSRSLDYTDKPAC